MLMPLWIVSIKRLIRLASDEFDATPRERILLVCEELNRRSRFWPRPTKRRNDVVRYDGLELLKAIITKYQNDELVATVSLQVLSATTSRERRR